MTGSSPERHEDRHPRLRADLARDVALAGEILGDEDVARRQPADGAVADLDVDGAREREHRVVPGRVVPGIDALGIEAADDDAAAGDQLARRRLIAARLEPRLDVLEVRLAVRTRVEADDGHGAPPIRSRGG